MKQVVTHFVNLCHDFKMNLNLSNYICIWKRLNSLNTDYLLSLSSSAVAANTMCKDVDMLRFVVVAFVQYFPFW
jgi:hypothetical protein